MKVSAGMLWLEHRVPQYFYPDCSPITQQCSSCAFYLLLWYSLLNSGVNKNTLKKKMRYIFTHTIQIIYVCNKIIILFVCLSQVAYIIITIILVVKSIPRRFQQLEVKKITITFSSNHSTTYFRDAASKVAHCSSNKL